jgi:hypothetical protein
MWFLTTVSPQWRQLEKMKTLLKNESSLLLMHHIDLPNRETVYFRGTQQTWLNK